MHDWFIKAVVPGEFPAGQDYPFGWESFGVVEDGCCYVYLLRSFEAYLKLANAVEVGHNGLRGGGLWRLIKAETNSLDFRIIQHVSSFPHFQRL